ncbi:MAG: Gfo/Idh/MocA family oxidoreductase [Pseudomonadota bacterium]
MADIGIGLLGAARITDKAIVHPVQVTPQCRLVCIAARDRGRADAYAKQHGVETVLATYDEVISDPQVDLIYNPLPINLHAEWTIKALQAGKHVLCEKPFAMNVDEAKAMVDTAKATGNRLIEAFHYRYHPAFETCLAWLAADEIGEVREIHAAFYVQIKDNGTEIRHRVETGGGAMMDLGCYPLHWALTVMGEAPRSVEAKATLTPTGVDETLTADLSFASGASARLTTSMAAGAKFRADMRLVGSKGEIHFTNPLAPHAGGRLRTTAGREAEVSPITTYTYQLASVLRAIQLGTPVPTEGDMILRQQAALDTVYVAAGLRHLRYPDSMPE